MQRRTPIAGRAFAAHFINIPAPARLAAPPPPQVLGQRRRELGFPLADGLMAEYDTAQGEHLGQAAQAQLVAQAPEHHERDDVGRILRPVQERGGAFVELLAAGAAAEAAGAVGRALPPLRHRLRPARYAPHPYLPDREGGPYGQADPRQPGAAARDLTEPSGRPRACRLERPLLAGLQLGDAAVHDVVLQDVAHVLHRLATDPLRHHPAPPARTTGPGRGRGPPPAAAAWRSSPARFCQLSRQSAPTIQGIVVWLVNEPNMWYHDLKMARKLTEPPRTHVAQRRMWL